MSLSDIAKTATNQTYADVNSLSMAAFTWMGYWYPNLTGAAYYTFTATFLTVATAFFSASQGTIVVGQVFDTDTTAQQNLALIHEVLLAYTQKDDIGLAAQLGLGTFSNNVDADAAFLNYFNNNCQKQ